MRKSLITLGIIGVTALLVPAGSARAEYVRIPTVTICNTQTTLESFIEYKAAYPTASIENALGAVNRQVAKNSCLFESVFIDSEKTEGLKDVSFGELSITITKVFIVGTCRNGFCTFDDSENGYVAFAHPPSI